MTFAEIITAFLFRHRVWGRIRLHRLLLQSRRLEVKTRHGLRLRLDPYQYVDDIVLRHGFYEEEVLAAALERLRPGEVFWDVGSNLGLHALTVSRLRPDVSIWAFEPNPRMASLIEAARQRNAVNVTLIELALDANAGRAKFYLHEGNSGRCGLHNWDANPRLPHIEVTTDTGDRVVAEHRAPTPNVVKLDVEGNQSQVLDGMRQLLASDSLHTVIFEDSPPENSVAKTILRTAGFTIETLVRRELTPNSQENYVARRTPALR